MNNQIQFNAKSRQSFVTTILCALLFFHTARVQAGDLISWTNGHSYGAVFVDNPTWFQARDAAAAMTFNGISGHLATFVTRAEQEFVIDQLGGGTYLNALWLGAYQDNTEPTFSEPYGGWKWITGEAWLGVASDDTVLPRSDFGFNNTYFDSINTEEFAITWWNTGGINDYYHTPSSTLGDSSGGPARGFIVEFDLARGCPNASFGEDAIIWGQPLARNGASEDTDPSAGGTVKYRFKRGSTIPIEIRALNCQGDDVTGVATVTATVSLFKDSNCDDAVDANSAPINFNGVGSSGGVMEKIAGKFKYNLDTSWLPATSQCYILRVTVVDHSTGEEAFEDVLLQAK